MARLDNLGHSAPPFAGPLGKATANGSPAFCFCGLTAHLDKLGPTALHLLKANGAPEVRANGSPSSVAR